jgi:superfamily II RNA helicase
MEPSKYLEIINPSQPCQTVIENPATVYPYPLDPFQQHALVAIEQGKNVLVTAKTGSGKTLVGEYLIHHIVRKGKRVFYTTPIKSLSNQKFHDLKQIFGIENVGIMTGDIKFNPDAQILVMTTEILRNLLYKRGTSTESLGLTASLSLNNLEGVVFDEVHYINDRDRGHVWEETLILLPPEIQLVMLSATIDRADRFANWLAELKQKPIVLLSTLYRIVPLTHCVLQGDELKVLMDSKDQFYEDVYRKWIDNRHKALKDQEDYQRKVKDARSGGAEGRIEGKARVASFLSQLNTTVRFMEEKNLLPALCFMFSRKGCERYAHAIETTLLDSSEAAKVKHIWDFHLHPYKEQLETLPQAHKLRELAEKGIAYHHSGLLPILKEIIEILFSRGFIKLLFATETFAVGLNMPTKTCLFLGLEKFSEDVQRLRTLRTDEYIQMAGRAGRRGKDPVGTIIYLPERDPIPVYDMKAMMMGGRSMILSKMQFHYDFLMKTLQANNLDWIRLMKDSYWFLQRGEAIQQTKKHILELQEKRNQLGFSEADWKELSQRDDLETANKTAVNAKRKETQRNLESWKNRHMGPKWDSLWKLYPQAKRTDQEIQDETAYLHELENFSDSLQPHVDFLTKHGFLQGEPDVHQLTKENLTEKGTVATEINEGHSILLPEFYWRTKCSTLSPQEIVSILVSFMKEDNDPDSQVSIESLQISTQCKNSLRELETIAREFEESEKKFGIQTPAGFWSLNTRWIDPLVEWMNGAHSNTICQNYDLFEGNLVRAVHKALNLLEELQSVATFKQDIELLQKLREAETLLKTGLATTDSLYLRLA